MASTFRKRSYLISIVSRCCVQRLTHGRRRRTDHESLPMLPMPGTTMARLRTVRSTAASLAEERYLEADRGSYFDGLRPDGRGCLSWAGVGRVLPTASDSNRPNYCRSGLKICPAGASGVLPIAAFEKSRPPAVERLELVGGWVAVPLPRTGNNKDPEFSLVIQRGLLHARGGSAREHFPERCHDGGEPRPKGGFLR